MATLLKSLVCPPSPRVRHRPQRRRLWPRRRRSTSAACRHKKEGDRATKLADKRIEQKGEVAMSVGMPEEPGAYVVGIYVGTGLEHTPLEPLELTK